MEIKVKVDKLKRDRLEISNTRTQLTIDDTYERKTVRKLPKAMIGRKRK